MKTVLITGANGEVGHGLIEKLSKEKDIKIITLDSKDLDLNLSKYVSIFIKGDILDFDLINKTLSENKIGTIFHLAAILSTSGEKDPELAHHVNVEGTMNLLKIANQICIEEKRVIKFVFPSSIAAYGLPSLIIKKSLGALKEDEFPRPQTMYGINKLYCENLGIYFSDFYQRLNINKSKFGIDFRCVRFPGLISASTIPTGGTSDYAPEMLHAGAKGDEKYECFVRADSVIPFMAMPDAIKALLMISNATKLSQRIYNVDGFSVSAKEIEKVVVKNFPNIKVSYKSNVARQAIVDSWPERIDDSKARSDWNWKPDYNFVKAFENYLIPGIREHYINNI